MKWTKEEYVLIFEDILLQPPLSWQTRVSILFLCKFSFLVFYPLLDFFLRWMPHKSIPQTNLSLDNGTIYWLRLGWPMFGFYCAPRKPSITGHFGNNLQTCHNLIRSDYGRLQNHVFVALRGIAMWQFCIFLCFNTYKLLFIHELLHT